MSSNSDNCIAFGDENGFRDGNGHAMNYMCPECGANKGYHIYEHLLAAHSYSKDDIERMKRERRSRKLMSGTTEVHSCDVCGLLCKTKKTLAKHKREKKHTSEESIDVQRCLLCPLCEEQVKNHWDLIEHVNEEHPTSHEHCVVEAKSFDDKEKFEEWKAHLQNEAVVRFSVVNRRKVVGGSVTYMRCSRAMPCSRYVTVERPGSKKIVGNCTAFMRVRENANKYHVKFCRTHCGHEMEPAKLRIDARSEEYIASLLRDGFRPHQILGKIRAEHRNNGKHSRLYYTSYSDIRHIAIRNKIDPSRKDESDVRSVEIRVREGTEDDGIRRYTPAVNETGDGFSLVIITPLQREWLARYGRRAIIMDDTFNLTAYCLRLATVVVVDEWDRGLPAAYLLSNRMTENEVASLFTEVKSLLPSFDTEFFMSDDCNSFYNGFLKVFPQSKAQKLLCSFHILQAVKRNCSARLKQKEKAETVLASVRSLCKTLNPQDFASKYSSLITFLNGEGEKDMVDYFERTWSNRIHQWGGFARRSACVATSMLIERFHKRLKHEVSSSRSNMRIDALVETIIAMVPDMEEDRTIKMARGLKAGRYRLLQHHRAHALAVKLFNCNQGAIAVVEKGLWTVKDRGGVHYVEQHFRMCDPKINNHCNKCKACAYAFLCDCMQDAKAGISCAHVHAALMYAPEGLLTDESGTSPSSSADSLSVAGTNENCDEAYVNVQQFEEQGGHLRCNMAVERTSTDVLDANKELLQQFESVNAAARSKLISLSRVADEGVQERMKELIEIMKDVDAKASREMALHRTRNTPRPQIARRAELSLTGRPPNHSPIRLAKRAALKPKSTQQKHQPVEEFNADEISCCIICFRRMPDDGVERDLDEWLKCSVCGLWAHESCSGEGASCPYDEGTFNCSLLND